MKRVLVTGGAGFIGSHTCLSLIEKGYEIVIIDSLINSSIDSLKKVDQIAKNYYKLEKKKLFFFKGDIREREFLEKVFFESREKGKPIEGVIHFAGLKAVNESLSFPLKYWESNVIGTMTLLNVMEQYNCRTIVFSSSATIYGEADGKLINENSLIRPSSPYGSTKLAIEYLLNDLFSSKSNQWKIINLRYFNPIGAHPSGLIGESPLGNPSNIFPSITQVASRKRNILNIYGKDWPTNDGTCVRDYIHVMDLAEGHLAALNYLEENEPQLRNFNLGTGVGTSVLELLNTFQKVNMINIPHRFLSRREGDLAQVIADNSLAKKYLNWHPKRNLEEMCVDGWKWQSLNPNGF